MSSKSAFRGVVAAVLAWAVAGVSACAPQESGGTTGAAGSQATGGTSGAAGTTGSGGAGLSAGSGGTGASAGAGGTGGPAGGSGGASPGGTTGGSTIVGTGGAGGTAGAGTGEAGRGGTGGQGTGGAGGRGGSGTAGSRGGSAGGGATGTAGQGGLVPLPDPGTDGDGDSMVGPTYTPSPDLSSKGNPKGRTFTFSITSKIFDGKDPTLTMTPVNVTRQIQGYVPAMYKDGTLAPVLIIQDGPGELTQVSNALDNLTISTDPTRKLPAFIVIAVPSGGSDSIGSERGLEYDTLSDRYARYITQEVMPGVQNAVKANYPNLKFDPSASGRAALGCSSGGAAAFTMAWFRPDLFSRVIAYSATLVAQQDPKAPESMMYPHGAWDYHSDLQLIKNDTMGREKFLRIFHNANEMDNGYTAAESGRHNWVMAAQRTAAALKAKNFHYKFVFGLGQGHCGGSVQSTTLADALVWVWRGYQQPSM
jgi:enterochelin esterase-like enzyme